MRYPLAVDVQSLAGYIRAVPDFPRPGILFRDITPLLATPAAFGLATEALAERLAAYRVESLVAIESRGFLLGAALAHRLRLPLLLVRKPGKLPRATASVEYQLEYGSDRLEIHADAVAPASRCAIVDDVLATGGTAAAAVELVRGRGGEIACLGFLLELAALSGRARLGAAPVEALLRYD